MKPRRDQVLYRTAAGKLRRIAVHKLAKVLPGSANKNVLRVNARTGRKTPYRLP